MGNSVNIPTIVIWVHPHIHGKFSVVLVGTQITIVLLRNFSPFLTVRMSKLRKITGPYCLTTEEEFLEYVGRSCSKLHSMQGSMGIGQALFRTVRNHDLAICHIDRDKNCIALDQSA
jgi:hypothetical protein